jgi:hypothetical protein
MVSSGDRHSGGHDAVSPGVPRLRKRYYTDYQAGNSRLIFQRPGFCLRRAGGAVDIKVRVDHPVPAEHISGVLDAAMLVSPVPRSASLRIRHDANALFV